MTSIVIAKKRYVLKKILGKGSFGIAYLAEEEGNRGKKYVIKKIKTSKHDSHRMDEIHTLEKLSKEPRCHQGVVCIHDYMIENDYIYILMDYIEGIALSDTKVTIRQFESIFLESINILKYLHQQGIVHSDIKPENIMYNRKTNQTTFIDFGLSLPVRKDMTRGGTRGFWDPLGFTTCEISDIYSLGATFYTILAGDYAPDYGALSTYHTTYEKVIKKIESFRIDPFYKKVICHMMNPYGLRPSVEEIEKAMKTKSLTIEMKDYMKCFDSFPSAKKYIEAEQKIVPKKSVRAKKGYKECKEGKIRNPKTGRCIKSPSLKKPKKSVRAKKGYKECKEGKIRNPKTGRCIKSPAFKKK
jgi:serine/threonine protein kinase